MSSLGVDGANADVPYTYVVPRVQQGAMPSAADCMEINEEFVGREHSPRLRLRSHGEPEALGLTPVVSAESHLIRGHHVTISMPK